MHPKTDQCDASTSLSPNFGYNRIVRSSILNLYANHW